MDDPDDGNTLPAIADVLVITAAALALLFFIALLYHLLRRRQRKQRKAVTTVLASSALTAIEMQPVPNATLGLVSGLANKYGTTGATLAQVPVQVATRVGDPFISIPIASHAQAAAAASECCTVDPAVSIHVDVSSSASVKGGGSEALEHM